MICDDVKALLDLEDLDARVDPDELLAHLTRCEVCARRYPEVGPLVAARPVATEGRRAGEGRRRVTVAAAALIGAALALQGVGHDSRRSAPRSDPQRATSIQASTPPPAGARVLAVASTLKTSLVSYRRHAAVTTSTVTQTVTFPRGRRIHTR